MKDIRVYGELELLSLVEAGAKLPDHLVSIGNPRLPWKPVQPGERVQSAFRPAFRRILRLGFFDVERADLLGELRPRRIPKRGDVRRVIRFYESTKAEATGYVVHCWGGISRSTAVALGLLYLETGSEDEAARLLRAMRPQAGPHRLIARHFDAELGSRLEEAADRIRGLRMEELRRELYGELEGLVEELPEAD
jgi:predicted protein tyrosine phosphatase